MDMGKIVRNQWHPFLSKQVVNHTVSSRLVPCILPGWWNMLVIWRTYILSRSIVIKSHQVFVFFPSHTCSYQEDICSAFPTKKIRLASFSKLLREFGTSVISFLEGVRNHPRKEIHRAAQGWDTSGIGVAKRVGQGPFVGKLRSSGLVVTLSCSM